MADAAEGSSEAQVSFKVKTSGEGSHSITMAESATVLELKTKLSGEDYENVGVERMRLIYSGRVMKNDDALAVYKIKNGNTIHMVKSAASNRAAGTAASSAGAASGPGGSSTPTPAIPQNMAAGTSANNPLAGLTGARYAGHLNLPNASMFGADGGMGAPPDEESMADMLSNPAIAQSMNEALNNPEFVNFMINQNPMLRDMPNAREVIQSPAFRAMMTNPEAIRSAARLRRAMGAGGLGGPGAPAAFPAPGATDTTPAGSPATRAPADGGAAAPGGAAGGAGVGALPAGFPGLGGAGGGPGSLAELLRTMPPIPPGWPGAGVGGASPPPFPGLPGLGAGGAGGGDAANAAFAAWMREAARGMGEAATAAGATPGAAARGAGAGPPGASDLETRLLQELLLEAQREGGGGAGGGAGGLGALAGLGLGPFGGFGAPPPAPPDNRPPEERYAEQLRQLNEMGFYDFDRNVAALRRSGGNVQGAIDHLLGGN